MDTEHILALIAGLALVPTFASVIAIPFGRWVARRWKAVRHAERDLRLQAEAELLECRKAGAVLEVQVRYLESVLDLKRLGDAEEKR